LKGLVLDLCLGQTRSGAGALRFPAPDFRLNCTEQVNCRVDLGSTTAVGDHRYNRAQEILYRPL